MTPKKRTIADVEDDLRGVVLLVHGEAVDASSFVRAMQLDFMAYGFVVERVNVDGSRELISPQVFARTCSRCGRGFVDTGSAHLEMVARSRCAACRRG